ncbi:hypothetical protein M0R45_013998 [Rubus argutus]|uniref:Uncharacterized protein n=1 Tax=Rubus argutus TaxID=59490 RepID=A0AAW1XKZ7_RUBAR
MSQRPAYADDIWTEKKRALAWSLYLVPQGKTCSFDLQLGVLGLIQDWTEHGLGGVPRKIGVFWARRHRERSGGKNVETRLGIMRTGIGNPSWAHGLARTAATLKPVAAGRGRSDWLGFNRGRMQQRHGCPLKDTQSNCSWWLLSC